MQCITFTFCAVLNQAGYISAAAPNLTRDWQHTILGEVGGVATFDHGLGCYWSSTRIGNRLQKRESYLKSGWG